MSACRHIKMLRPCFYGRLQRLQAVATASQLVSIEFSFNLGIHGRRPQLVRKIRLDPTALAQIRRDVGRLAAVILIGVLNISLRPCLLAPCASKVGDEKRASRRLMHFISARGPCQSCIQLSGPEAWCARLETHDWALYPVRRQEGISNFEPSRTVDGLPPLTYSTLCSLASKWSCHRTGRSTPR